MCCVALKTYVVICRREMMPLLSLIFSALFILFGTVVIQAFRLVAFPYARLPRPPKYVTIATSPSSGISETRWRKLERLPKENKVIMLSFFLSTPAHPLWAKHVICVFFSDSSDDKQTKPKAKDGTKAENGSPGPGGTSRQEYIYYIYYRVQNLSSCFLSSVYLLLISSRPPKKNFVEVTELTDITYMSNLVKLRPGHMNIVLVLTDASKNILLSKFAKEVYSFTG